jgi:lysozyme
VPNSLRSLLILHEGRRPKKYRDSLGYWTIGVGHLIDERKGGSLPVFIVSELNRRGLDVYDSDPMPEDLIDKLLDWDIAEHCAQLEKLLLWVKSLDPVRYAVIADMFFNLGPEPFDNDGIKDWPVFLGQVARGEYEAAANNMLRTLWAKQVKSRAVRLAEMMRSGAWPA